MRVLKGWPVYLGAGLGLVVLQTLLIIGDPIAEVGWGFGLRVLASFLVVVLAVSAVVAAATDAAAGEPAAVRRPTMLFWVAGFGLLAIGAAVLSPWLVSVVLLLGVMVLPAVAVAAPVGSAFRAIGRVPLRAVLAVLGFVLLAVISWVLALMLGFFVTGLAGAALTWLWFGLLLVLVQRWWCGIYHRGSAVANRDVTAVDA
ncbi:hypothetical protein GIS00_06620 [Nakamurella sp. YIM 132087]|uniref:Uncharacterized protein n=1 Tax=Nakamurella alba TaxID=2665158 RepID=A0A7K1FHS0_9ACTN|nr:hypothetical protein [Nakamurella alba]MTD13616.1 hypothetical protein [Nakamurella alba]